jgi:hypothetical protein
MTTDGPDRLDGVLFLNVGMKSRWRAARQSRG